MDIICIFSGDICRANINFSQNRNLKVLALILKWILELLLIFSWLMVFIVGSFNNIQNISNKTLIFLILLALETGGSWLCYYKSFQDGEASVVV